MLPWDLMHLKKWFQKFKNMQLLLQAKHMSMKSVPSWDVMRRWPAPDVRISSSRRRRRRQTTITTTTKQRQQKKKPPQAPKINHTQQPAAKSRDPCRCVERNKEEKWPAIDGVGSLRAVERGVSNPCPYHTLPGSYYWMVISKAHMRPSK